MRGEPAGPVTKQIIYVEISTPRFFEVAQYSISCTLLKQLLKPWNSSSTSPTLLAGYRCHSPLNRRQCSSRKHPLSIGTTYGTQNVSYCHLDSRQGNSCSRRRERLVTCTVQRDTRTTWNRPPRSLAVARSTRGLFYQSRVASSWPVLETLMRWLESPRPIAGGAWRLRGQQLWFIMYRVYLVTCSSKRWYSIFMQSIV
jgi:hypothetical protein